MGAWADVPNSTILNTYDKTHEEIRRGITSNIGKAEWQVADLCSHKNQESKETLLDHFIDEREHPDVDLQPIYKGRPTRLPGMLSKKIALQCTSRKRKCRPLWDQRMTSRENLWAIRKPKSHTCNTISLIWQITTWSLKFHWHKLPLQ